MIVLLDFRSDTLTKPTAEMLYMMKQAEVGDDGRMTLQGRGEDPTVNKLENLAAKITGKQSALFCSSGTMANIVSILTHCNRGEKVGIDRESHIYQSEKSIFMQKYFGMDASFYEVDARGVPSLNSIKEIIKEQKVSLICLENSIGYRGGTCISENDLNKICNEVRRLNVPVHLDGARIFNVAVHYNLSVKRLTLATNSVQFCLSKGIGAPIGSMLCGDKTFIRRAREIRNDIGGGLRQAGVLAAAGIVALTENVDRLKNDHENAQILAKQLSKNKFLKLNPLNVETNMVLIDVSPTGYSAQHIVTELAKRGLLIRKVSNSHVRLMTYQGIKTGDVQKAAQIINDFFYGLVH